MRFQRAAFKLRFQRARANWGALFLIEVSSSVRCKVHALILRLDSPLSSAFVSFKAFVFKSYISKRAKSFS